MVRVPVLHRVLPLLACGVAMLADGTGHAAISARPVTEGARPTNVPRRVGRHCNSVLAQNGLRRLPWNDDINLVGLTENIAPERSPASGPQLCSPANRQQGTGAGVAAGRGELLRLPPVETEQETQGQPAAEPVDSRRRAAPHAPLVPSLPADAVDHAAPWIWRSTTAEQDREATSSTETPQAELPSSAQADPAPRRPVRLPPPQQGSSGTSDAEDADPSAHLLWEPTASSATASVDNEPDPANAADRLDPARSLATDPNAPIRNDRFHDDDQDGTKALPEPPAQSLAEAVSRAQASVARGLELAERQALYSARAELVQSLRIVAQAMDARSGEQTHVTALVSALRALREAQDFVPYGPVMDRGVNVAQYLPTHRTPVLKQQDPRTLTPRSAQRQYHTHAQQQFEIACGGEPVASEALAALGKVSRLMYRDEPETLAIPTAMTFYRAALLVDDRNPVAANELGVLEAKHNRLRQARRMLLQSVSVRPTPEAWHNLSVVHQRLGQSELAAQAKYESDLARNRTNAPHQERSSRGPDSGELSVLESAPRPETLSDAAPPPSAPTDVPSGPTGAPSARRQSARPITPVSSPTPSLNRGKKPWPFPFPNPFRF